VEKIAAVDNHVGPKRQNALHHALERVVHVLLAGVHAGVGHAVEGLEAEVGVGEVKDAHDVAGKVTETCCTTVAGFPPARGS
jgi:hypothetical protein